MNQPDLDEALLVALESTGESREDSILTAISLGAKAEQDILDNLLSHFTGTGETERCRMLIDSGADTETRNEWGATPIFVASFQGNKNLCKYLIEKKADVHAVCYHNDLSPIAIAVFCKKYEIVKLLLQGGANSTDKIIKTPVSEFRRGDQKMDYIFKKYSSES